MRTPRSHRRTVRTLVVVGSLTLIGAFGTAGAAAVSARPSPAAADGTVKGLLGYEGGAYPGKFHRTSGVVDVAGPKSTITVSVPDSGRFTVHLAPATYELTGCGGTNDAQCGPAQKVKVASARTVHVKVPWALVP